MPKQKPDKKKRNFRGNQYTKATTNEQCIGNGLDSSSLSTGQLSDGQLNHVNQGQNKMPEPEIYHPNNVEEDAVEGQDVTFRAKRKKRLPVSLDSQSACSVCGLTVRRQDMEAHYQSEVDQLERLTSQGSENMRYRFRRRNSKYEQLIDMESNDRFEEYLRLKRKRETRLRKIVRDPDKAGSASSSVTQCPVCHVTLTGTPMERNRHAEICLNRLSGGVSPDEEDDHEDIDIEGEEYEEYTWCGETRIRATTMVEGGLRGLGYKTVTTSNEENAETELDVEGDDSALYGTPQYTEADIVELHIPDTGQDGDTDRGGGVESNNNIGDEPQETNNTEQSTDENQSAIQRTFDPVSLSGEFDEANVSPVVIQNEDMSPVEMGNSSSGSGNYDVIIESLKTKIHELEQQVSHQTPTRCLICLESYTRPVISIQCWHVYCEDCWMKTLGHKRLCPQCQMITSPNQLRQIYL